MAAAPPRYRTIAYPSLAHGTSPFFPGSWVRAPTGAQRSAEGNGSRAQTQDGTSDQRDASSTVVMVRTFLLQRYSGKAHGLDAGHTTG